MRIGAVCVHFHAAELASEAVDKLRHSGRLAGVDLKMVIVDNGSTEDEKDRLRSIGVDLVISAENRGYAGGVNTGARHFPDVDAWIFMNPDVLVEPDCVGRLVTSLKGGAAVVGPRFYWDDVGGFQLPPTEVCGRMEELRRLWASTRPNTGALRARRRWRRHARRHWQATEPISSYDLSGALLAIRRDAWNQVGPFDEKYRLYFEETDWLQRCRREGLSAVYDPGAEAIHLYAQSTPTEPRSRQWFEESHERFRRQHYGDSFVRGLRLVAPKIKPETSAPVPVVERLNLTARSLGATDQYQDLWVEISPASTGFPAAGKIIESRDEAVIGEKLWRQMAPGDYQVRFLGEDTEVGMFAVRKHSQTG